MEPIDIAAKERRYRVEDYNKLMTVRLEKAERLRQLGQNPYPNGFQVSRVTNHYFLKSAGL